VENYKKLLTKYLRNECTQKELKKVLLWINNPDNSETLKKYIDEDWDNFAGESEHRSHSNLLFEPIKQKIQDKKKNAETNNNHTHVWKQVSRIAAGFLVPVATGYLTFYFLVHTQKDNSISYNEITAPLGSKTIIRLGDSTKVWLNSGSTLRYPQKFAGKYREVQLSGEAFFDVKKNKDIPFIVTTTELNIKVLGTSFNVKAYPEEGTIETTLIKGLVTISKSGSGLNSKDVIFLNPNQRATYVKKNGKLVLAEVEKKVMNNEALAEGNKKRKEQIIFTKNVDTEQFTAWKDEKLVFKNEEFESLCIKLERWYRVEIHIRDEKLKKFHYTGILRKETINDVIKILGYTMPFKYKIDHSIITIWLEDSKKHQE
jgi:transmembrane sensor